MWTEAERHALVEFIALFTTVTDECEAFKWPSTKNPEFWSKCAEALACTTGMPKRSGEMCLCGRNVDLT